MTEIVRQSVKDRVRARIAADRARPARSRLYDMLCATNTSADADALLDRAERESGTADRLRSVLNLCDAVVRGPKSSAETTSLVQSIYRAALGDEPGHSGPGLPPAQLPDWAIIQLSGQGIDPGDVTHFFGNPGGRKLAVAVDGKPVFLDKDGTR